ncbi:hypothetical protein ABZ891_24795 [Streptomyces sp. NPDC047023]|uniref:hypothetical protein n=1 Tax=Streptomyces sp. NPDC047023 TaxID=3155139 RepID=UPI00340173EB
MNRNVIRTGGAVVLAALAFGIGGGVANAQTAAPAPAATVAAPALQEQQARIVAQALLNAPVELTAAERTELQAVVNGEAGAENRWEKIKRLFEKIPGAGRAVRGSYDDFVKWYKALDWKYRAPLAALGIGSDLWTLWQMFQ